MKSTLKKYFFTTIQTTKNQPNYTPANLAYNLIKSPNEKNQNNNLLVLHGFMGSQTNFRSIVKNNKISSLTNSYLIDQRNHGHSQHKPTMSTPELAFDIKNFIEEQNLKDSNLVLMGHSMGGRVVMEFLQNYPEYHDQIKGALIIDIMAEDYIELKNPTVMETYVMVNRLSQMDFKHKDMQKIKQELLHICGSQEVANFVQMQISEKNIDYTDSTKYYWRSNMKVFPESYQDMISHVTERTDYTGPVHSICGDRSTYVNKEIAEKCFTRLFKNFDTQKDLEFFENCTHWVHAEKPAKFIDSVSNKLNQWLN